MADDLDPSQNPFGRPDTGSPLYSAPVPPAVPRHTKRAVAAANLAPLPAPAPVSPPPSPPPPLTRPHGGGIAGGASDAIMGLGRNIGHVGAEAWRGQQAAQRQLVGDVAAQGDPRTADPYASAPGGKLTQDLIGVMGGGALSGIAKATVGEAVAPAIAPAIKAYTGGRYTADPQKIGDLATMAIPFLGEANEARAASAFAREAGISEEAAQTALAAARKTAAGRAAMLKTEAKTARARRAAAMELIHQSGDSPVAKARGWGKGELKSDEAREAGEEFVKVGAGKKPTLMDVATRPTLRLLRAAGSKMGKADAVLDKYRQGTRLRVGEEARRRTQEEAPNPEQSVEERIESVGKERDTRADTLFPGPYRTRLKTDDRLFNVLFKGFPEGPAMVRRAMDDASRRMLTDPDAEQQFHDLRSLHKYVRDKAKFEDETLQYQGELIKLRRANPNATPEELEWLAKDIKKPVPPEPPEISAGALDRVFRQARDTASDPLGKGTRTTRGGIGIRAQQIGEYLDDIPGLKEARADYNDYSKRIEVLKFKQNISKMLPREFNRFIESLSPEQASEAMNKFIEDFAEAHGTSSRKVQSSEDIITTGPNTRDNLRALFTKVDPEGGEAKAEQFMRAMELLGKSIDNANLAAGKGSQTAMIQNDIAETAARGAMAAFTGRTHMMMYYAGRFLQNWLLDVPAEANEILAEWATGKADEKGNPTMTLQETLQDIMDAVKGNTETGKFDSLVPPKVITSKFPPEIAAILAGAALRDKPKDEPDQGQLGQNIAPGQPPADNTPLDPAQNPFGKGAADDTGDAQTTPTADTSGGAPAPPEIEPLLQQVAVLEGSGDDAVSPAGAIGKYQIWPPTAREYGLDPERLFDPEYNKQAAVMILGDLNQRYGGDLGAILVAYNGGPGRADEWLASGRNPAVLKPETRKYLYNAGLLGADALGSSDPGGGIAGPSPGMPLIPNFGSLDGQ